MENETTLYIIKPEAIAFSKEISKSISDLGLTIVTKRVGKLPMNLVDKIYFDSPREIIEATKYFMFSEPCEVGIVQGIDAINRLKLKCGASTNPLECEHQSIRYKYGIHNPKKYKGTTYYQNAIHFSKTKEEAEKDISLLKQFICDAD